jgi:hypothetical protein
MPPCRWVLRERVRVSYGCPGGPGYTMATTGDNFLTRPETAVSTVDKATTLTRAASPGPSFHENEQSKKRLDQLPSDRTIQ